MSMSRCEWIRSERFAKKQKEEAKNREKNNPMKAGEKVGRMALIFLQTFSTGGKYLQYWKYKQKVGSTVYRTCGHETLNNFLVELYSMSGQ